MVARLCPDRLRASGKALFNLSLFAASIDLGHDLWELFSPSPVGNRLQSRLPGDK